MSHAAISRSHRLAGLVQSDIRRMTRECHRLNAINLGQGICDLPTLDAVKEAAIQAIRDERSIYTLPEGLAELREAIARKLQRDNAMSVDPHGQIVVTIGASGAFTCACHALLNPGDGVMLLEPYYGYHLNTMVVAGLEPHFCALELPSLRLDMDRLKAALKPNTKALVLCTPSNPSGKMFTREELEAVSALARERDLLVITDEIYEYIRYDGRDHISPATIPGLEDRTVSIMGMSKTYSITGWRLGYAVAPPEMAEAMTLVNDLFYVCAPHPLQVGVTAGLAAPVSFYEEMSADYQRKRDQICDALEGAGLTPLVPEGAYYVLADVQKWGLESAQDAAMHLLEQGGVAAIPGSSFFQDPVGETVLRLCFAKEDDVLDEACRRLRSVAQP